MIYSVRSVLYKLEVMLMITPNIVQEKKHSNQEKNTKDMTQISKMVP